MKQVGTVTNRDSGERGAALVEASLAMLPYLLILASFLITSVLFAALALCTTTALHAELARRAYNPSFPTPSVNDLVVGFATPALRSEAVAHQTTSIADVTNRRYMEYLNFVAGVLSRIGYPIGSVNDPQVSSAYVVIRSFNPADPANELSVKEVHITTTLIGKLGVFASVLSSDRFTGVTIPPIVIDPVVTPVDPIDVFPVPIDGGDSDRDGRPDRGDREDRDDRDGHDRDSRR